MDSAREFSDLSMSRTECPKCGATWINGEHRWSGTGVKIPPNNEGTRPAGRWSDQGGDGQPQPDNREWRVTVKHSDLTFFQKNI